MSPKYNLLFNKKNGIKKTIFDIYEIDSNGYIYNLVTKKYVNGSIDKDGYICIRVKENNVYKRYSLHKLVISAFNSDYNDKTDLIAFKDNDKTNCSLDNLYIKKNTRISMLPTEEMNIFFEQQDPYKIVNHFVNFLYSRGREIALTNSFEREDLLQVLIYEIWKRLPRYFITIKDTNIDLTYKDFCFGVLFNYLKNKAFWEFVTSQYSMIQTIDNTFDYEHSSMYASVTDAVQNGYSSYFESLQK